MLFCSVLFVWFVGLLVVCLFVCSPARSLARSLACSLACLLACFCYFGVFYHYKQKPNGTIMEVRKQVLGWRNSAPMFWALSLFGRISSLGGPYQPQEPMEAGRGGSLLCPGGQHDAGCVLQGKNSDRLSFLCPTAYSATNCLSTQDRQQVFCATAAAKIHAFDMCS